MAGNNQIQLLRGSRSNSTGKDTVAEALKTLSPGQPLYSKDENYLYIGGDEDGAVAPVTTDRIKKGNTYVKIVEETESDGSTTKYIRMYGDKCTISGTVTAGDDIITLGSVYARKNLGALGPNVDNKRHSIYTNGITTSDGKYSSDPSLVVGISDNNANLDSAIQYGHDSILPINNSNTASIGTFTKPFHWAYIDNITSKKIESDRMISSAVESDAISASSVTVENQVTAKTIVAYIGKWYADGTDMWGTYNDNNLPTTKKQITVKLSPEKLSYKLPNQNEVTASWRDVIDSANFKLGNIMYGTNTIGYVAQLGTIVCGCIWKGILLSGEQSFTIDSIISPCPKQTNVGSIPGYPVASGTGSVTSIPCTINGNTITTNTGSSLWASKSNADFYFWYDINTKHTYPAESA